MKKMKTPKPPNRRVRLIRLMRLRDVIRKAPTKRFNMRFWERRGAYDGHSISLPAPTCGTEACAAGWAAADPYFKKIGLHVVYRHKANVTADIVFHHHTGFDALEVVFGLGGYGEAQKLFRSITANESADLLNTPPADQKRIFLKRLSQTIAFYRAEQRKAQRAKARR